jgi:AraC-like DNA-binding protein
MKARHRRTSSSLARASRVEDSAVAADTLSDVLNTVRMTGALFFLADCSEPFALEAPQVQEFAHLVLPRARHIISYHVIARGRAWGGLVDGTPLQLEEGDVLLVPHGHPYFVASAPSLRSGESRESSLAFFQQMAAGMLPPVVKSGAGGQSTMNMICGFLGCDADPFNPLVATLPPVLRIPRPAEGAEDRLSHLVDFAVAESKRPRSGGRTVLLRLSELMFVEVVRRCVESGAVNDSGWLLGLRDPVVGRALALLHMDPARAWTLEGLARAVGASRSALALRFSEMVGDAPMHYLTRWRMQVAARMLSEGTAKVGAVARDVGYESEAAFHRAFKREAGVAPGAWRRGERRAVARRF